MRSCADWEFCDLLCCAFFFLAMVRTCQVMYAVGLTGCVVLCCAAICRDITSLVFVEGRN